MPVACFGVIRGGSASLRGVICKVRTRVAQDGVVMVGRSEERSTLWPNHAMTINKTNKAQTRLPKTPRELPTNPICITSAWAV